MPRNKTEEASEPVRPFGDAADALGRTIYRRLKRQWWYPEYEEELRSFVAAIGPTLALAAGDRGAERDLAALVAWAAVQAEPLTAFMMEVRA